MTDGVANLLLIAEDVLDFVTSNAILLTFCVSGILGIGISVVKRLVGRY